MPANLTTISRPRGLGNFPFQGPLLSWTIICLRPASDDDEVFRFVMQRQGVMQWTGSEAGGSTPGPAGRAEPLSIVDLQGSEGAVADSMVSAARCGIQHLHDPDLSLPCRRREHHQAGCKGGRSCILVPQAHYASLATSLCLTHEQGLTVLPQVSTTAPLARRPISPVSSKI